MTSADAIAAVACPACKEPVGTGCTSYGRKRALKTVAGFCHGARFVEATARERTAAWQAIEERDELAEREGFQR